MAEEITRGEFEMLRQIVNANQARLEAIDLSGTRGVGALTSRVDDLVKNMAEFKLEVSNDFRDHRTQHETEENRRIAGRRWAVTTAVAICALLLGLYPLAILALHNGH